MSKPHDPQDMKPGDRALVDDYRRASEIAGEAPSPAVRAAVLAAATRAVDARPQVAAARRAAAAPAAMAEQAEEPALAQAAAPVTPLPVRPRSRVPLALAATVVLSSIAVLLATRVDREQQAEQARITEAAPAASGLAQPAPAPAAAPESKAAPMAAPSVAPPVAPALNDQAPRQAERSAPIVSGTERAKKAAPARNETARERADDTPMPAPSLAAPSESAPSGALSAPVPMTPAPAAMPTAPKASAPATDTYEARVNDRQAFEPAAPVVSAPAPAPAAAAPAPSFAAKPAAPLAREAKKAEAPDSVRYAHEDDPVRWLDHIKRLRAQGLDAEADVQLKRFRERYPNTTVPPEALRRVGTQ